MRGAIEAENLFEEHLDLLGYLADEIVKLSQASGKSGKGMLLMLHYLFMVLGEQEKIQAESLNGILNIIEDKIKEFNDSKIDHSKDEAPSTRVIIH